MLAVMPKVPYGELLVSLDFLRHTNFFLMNIMIQICIVSPLQSTLQSFIFLHYKKIYFTNNKRENNLKTAYHILHGLDLKNPPSQPFQKWEEDCWALLSWRAPPPTRAAMHPLWGKALTSLAGELSWLLVFSSGLKLTFKILAKWAKSG